MTRNSGKVHVVRVRKTGYVDRQGRARDYSSAYLRRTYREAGKVKNETVANISALPDHVIDLIDAGLKGQQLVPAAQAVTIAASLPHGHVAAAHAMAKKLGLPALLGPAGRRRDLALALVISRVVKPGSTVASLRRASTAADSIVVVYTSAPGRALLRQAARRPVRRVDECQRLR